MKSSMLNLIGIVIILCFQGCRGPAETEPPAVDRASELAQIEEAITNSICWAMTKDTVKLYGSLVQDSSLFIVNPDSSFVRGINQIRQVAETVWLTDRFRATECRISNLRISLAKSGTVAWYYCLLDDIGEWDGQKMGWQNTRWTGVLEKTDGQWQVVQMHFSFASE